jgi:hypothetical protein
MGCCQFDREESVLDKTKRAAEDSAAKIEENSTLDKDTSISTE